MIVYLTWDTTDLIGGHFIYCYVLHATDISGFTIPDTKLANNNMSKEFLVHPKPDLRPRLIPPATSYILVFNEDGTPYTGDELQIGQRVRLQATIRNDGQVYLPEVNVTFYTGDPDDPDTDQIGTNQTISMGPNDDINVTVLWEVAGAVGTMDLTVVVNEFDDVPESNYDNNENSETFNIAVAEITLSWMEFLGSKYTVGDTVSIQVTTVFTESGIGVPNVPYNIRIYNAIGDEAIGAAVTGTSNPVGTIVNEITVPTTEGEYYVQVTVTYGGIPHDLASDTFTVEPEEEPFPWLLIFLLIIIAIVAVLIVGVALAKFGLGKLVECGECGAFIPEGEKKCPKCGAVFETDTARCSECGGWIPSKSKSCPECGAIFAGIEKDKKDYIERMKTQYMEYVDQYRDEAKKDLGTDMTDEQFMDWWKANPKYVGFEEWLAREEELRKGKTRNCPSCNSINPESAAICFKCGTIFKTEEEEEDFIEEETGPPPEVAAKAVPAAVKTAPPTVVPKKVVQSPKGGGAPPTVVPKKVVKAPPTVVPKKVVKKPPEDK
jgi:RNA polymerase subunit RPABC4/transcription elongation factor Spt4